MWSRLRQNWPCNQIIARVRRTVYDPHIRSEGNKGTDCQRIPCNLRTRLGRGWWIHGQPFEPGRILFHHDIAVACLVCAVACVAIQRGNLPMFLRYEAESDQYFATHSSGLYFKINDHPPRAVQKQPSTSPVSRNSSRVGSHFHVSKLEFSVCIQYDTSKSKSYELTLLHQVSPRQFESSRHAPFKGVFRAGLQSCG